MQYGQVVLEIFITLIVVCIQYYYFKRTKQRIKQLENSFPDHELNENNIDFFERAAETVELIKVESNKYSYEFVDIVNNINKYLDRNKGAVDFSIMKNVVDRSVESQEEDATSNISLPLYVGLMGTFLGIIVGLVGIAFGGVNDEGNINSFLGGVFIAMIASLMGLMLTVINSSGSFKRAKKINDKRRDGFFSFLQIQLLPHHGNSLYDVFNRFKDNIADFNEKFGQNIGKFDEYFSKNISDLKESVSSLSQNVGPVIENIKTQREFLKELKAVGYNRMAEANLKVFQVMNDAGPNFVKFIEKQRELNESITKTVEIVSLIDSLLNRLSKFENSINALGDRIDSADYMGSDLVTKVNRKMSELDSQFEVLKQHSQYSMGHIENHFDKEKLKIENLSQRVLNELQDALNFNTDNNPLIKLKLLDSVNEQLTEIKSRLNSNGEIKQLAKDLEATRGLIEDIKEKATNFENKMKEQGSKHASHGDNLDPISKASFWRRVNPFNRKNKRLSGSKA